MTSAVNVRSQLICGIFICIYLIVSVQCPGPPGPKKCGSGKVLRDEDFHSNYTVTHS